MCNATTVAKWQKVQNEFKRLKVEEMNLRLQICKDILVSTVKGTVRGMKGKFELKAVAKLGYTLNKAKYEEFKGQLTEDEIACINFKPEVKEGLFNKLPKDSILKLNCVTVKPATPSLEIVSVAE